MQKLATGPWAEQGSGRIIWCVEACDEYFSVGGALVKMIGKDLRRLGHDMPTLIPVELLPNLETDIERTVHETFGSRKLRLLDVGSCYNPFSKFDKFEVTAIDIAPAHSTVLSCDFLSVNILESSTRSEGKVAGNSLHHIHAGSFDIVIFSLLLSYFPSTHQRLQCCINAHKALCLHGILLIITPDSSHQNRHAGMMKSWKQCIETLGFHRWKYVKDTHLHCMAFRKTRVDIDYGLCLVSHHMLYIPQDSHDEPTPRAESQASLTKPSTHFDLIELPFCDSAESDND
jgi:SAM-dependent methyltransferase